MQYRKLEAVSAGVLGDPDLMDIRQEGMTSNVCTAREPYATLFAAAPDMLEALVVIAKVFDIPADRCAGIPHADMVREAIAKATGVEG